MMINGPLGEMDATHRIRAWPPLQEATTCRSFPLYRAENANWATPLSVGIKSLDDLIVGENFLDDFDELRASCVRVLMPDALAVT